MISVVMPAYNAAKFIAPAVESILKQTFSAFELIVIDDGSTDDTLAILRGYLEQDSRVRVIQSQHGGLSRALNQGISEAKYSWIARMDADDIALPERLQKQMDAAIANPCVVAWGTYAHHISSQQRVLSLARTGPATEEEFYDLRNNGHLVQLIHPTVLLKKEVLLKIGGYNPEFEPVEELELFDRMAAYGPTLVIPEPLLLYRVHSHSVSMQRFFFQRLMMRYVVARHRARLSGHQELSFEQFLQNYQQQPPIVRLKQQLNTSGMFCYRQAGLSFGEGGYLQACFYLGLSAVLNPKYSTARVWNQVLSPKTQRWFKAIKT